MTDNTRDEVEEFVKVLSLLDIPDNLKRAIGVFVINAGYSRKPSHEDGLGAWDEDKVTEFGTPKQKKVSVCECCGRDLSDFKLCPNCMPKDKTKLCKHGLERHYGCN